MNSSKTESIAISAIINEINKYDNLQENLRKRDKEPVWDGKIELYKKDSNKTTDIIGIIPVQVKGQNIKQKNKIRISQKTNTKAEEHTRNEAYYNVKISEIENYRKSNIGAIYFITEIDEYKDSQIYYKVFDLKTIEQILEENKTKNHKTKRIKFTPLEKNKLVSICLDFVKNLNIYKEIKTLPQTEIYDKKIVCYNYNTKYELEEIKKSNKVFFETNAYKEAKEKLERQNIVILHGEPWVGKTTTARKLVSEYIDQGYMFIYGNVDDLQNIKEQVAIDEKIICLLDDFLGSNVEYLEKNIADSTLDKIVGIFKNSKNKKLIFTTRTYIYNNAKNLFYKFYKSTSIKDEYLIDVTNYTYEEKGNILYNHMKINNLIGTETHKKIVEDEFYVDVITNDNFNPGVISLLCERLKNKKIQNVKEYILKALDDPNELWEEEYRKLSVYEKIILTIIVLYGVKVPELYVKEQFKQIIENENITLIDSETFAKSLSVLSDSFIKTTFNKNEERELEVSKHSIADYIINKISYREIDVERYIKSAKYVETLQYIYLIIKKDEMAEKLAQKAEKEFKTLKYFYYNKKTILFGIIKNRINPEREKFLKEIIEEQFICEDPEIVIDILGNETDILYDYTMEMFKNDIIIYGNIDMVYYLNDVLDCETFFKTCVKIFNYQKDTEYMIENIYQFSDAIANLISEEVEDLINEQMPEEIAREIIDGENLEDIKQNYIEETFFEEIPSLQNLYSKKYINKMLKYLHNYCDIDVDRERLNENIEDIKNEKTQEEKTSKYYKYKTVDEMQIKAIKEKFEKGINIKKEQKKSNEYYDILLQLMPNENWWKSSFTKENNEYEYNNLKLYKDFLDKRPEIDESVTRLAKEFLDYILHKKFNISDKSYKLLMDIAYDSFVKGKFNINKKDMQKYINKYKKELNELYSTGIIYQKEEETKFINTYIHIYIATNELIKRKENLVKIILDWTEHYEYEDEDEIFMDQLQNIFYLYSKIDRKNFNYYVFGAINCFINEIECQYNKLGKMKVARAIVNLSDIELFFNMAFQSLGSICRRQLYIEFVEFVTGIEIFEDLSRFDYGIYQKTLYQKCYNKEENEYDLNFIEIMKDKELRKIGDKLKIWEYLYDIYLQCEKARNILIDNKNADVFNIGKKYIEDKYFK